MTTLEWYFDFISGFAYQQLATFDRLPDDIEIVYRPVLFAGLLKHFGHKGPAEIPAKRRHTYRQWVWQAAHDGIPFRMPPAHPFNPLRALRLALALDCDARAIATIFDFIWAEGNSVEEAEGWERLIERLGVADAAERIESPAIKEALRAATAAAAARGVFGVPTFAIGDELFWGRDATPMLLDYIANPEEFRGGELARAANLPIGTMRRF